MVNGYRGIAFRIKGYPLTWQPDTYIYVDDDGAEYECEADSGEWFEDRNCGQVLAVMVGDDHEHIIDVDDLIPLDDDDYCHGCGQIGCDW
jgi:hypothetical protein